MALSAPQKRKEQLDTPVTDHRAAKRVKATSARAILAQTSDKASIRMAIWMC